MDIRTCRRVTLLFSLAVLLSSGGSADSRTDVYLRLDAEEKRYAEYRDSAAMIEAKLEQLDYINKSRSRFGLSPLDLDILASRVANKMAAEAARRGFSGHWNTAGEKPYHRYAFAGGVDHVSENAAAVMSSAPIGQSIDNQLSLMGRSHDRFMAETPPNDGHKQTVILPAHTHVGLGVAVHEGQFRYYEEYVDRYLRFFDPPSTAGVGQEFTVTVEPINPDHYVYAILVYYEPHPTPLSPSEINRKSSYPDYTNTKALTLWPWEIERQEGSARTTIPMEFSRRGLYYVNIYLHDEPYSTRSASTRGKLQASGLVVSVE